MVDWGRAQHVAKTGRRPPRALRGGGRLWLAALATAGAGLALSGSAYAAVGERPVSAARLGTAVAAGRSLISPQYQAKNADTALRTAPRSPAADPSGGDAPHVAAWADPRGRSVQSAGFGWQLGPAATWYRNRALQYQLGANIAELTKGRIAARHIRSTYRNVHSNDGSIAAQIDQNKVISNNTSGLNPQDARRLLQLGLFLALAYVLFVALWLWRTRGRPHGAGRVVRF